MTVLEAVIEQALKRVLESHGFRVLKLTTPGNNGTPDRLILRPTWSPGAPYVVELKRPKKYERRLQELVRDEWRLRGVNVLDMCNTIERVREIERQLLADCTEGA